MQRRGKADIKFAVRGQLLTRSRRSLPFNFETRLSVGQINSDFQKSCQAPKSKIFCFPRRANQWHWVRQPGPHEGRFAIVTMRWAGAAMDALASGAFFAPDENAKAYGEVVWSWRRDAGAKLAGSVPPATVTTSPLTGESTK